MGGRSSASGVTTFQNLGMQVESSIDPELFKGTRENYGDYAYELASDVAEYMDEDMTLVSYQQDEHKAYAVLSLRGDEGLEAIISTGGGTGTQLLSKVMRYMHSNGKGMYWRTDNDASRSYYDSMGLGKFREGKSLYKIEASEMKDAIKLVNKKIRKKR